MTTRAHSSGTPSSGETTGARALGAAGEAAAARYYERAGFAVVDCNWHCPMGELDLVCAGHGLLVFCEVKVRRRPGFGDAREAVGAAKQRRLRRAAARWLCERAPELRWSARSAGATQPDQALWPDLRFDVVAVTGGRVSVLEGAF